MRFPFRKRQEPVPETPAAALPTPPAAEQPGAAPLRVPRLREQATAADARTERIFRTVRADVSDLQARLEGVAGTPAEFADVDVEAVIASPEAAASLPPSLLVRGLLSARERESRLKRRLAKAESRSERLEAKLRASRQERAWLRGRLETLDEVIAALHANIEDLRLARDGAPPALAEPPAPLVIRPGLVDSGPALPAADEA
jgi:hypothetical protein